jgi:enoyl-CoA hydratase
VVPAGQARAAAEALASGLAALPQACLRSDRASALAGATLGEDEAMANEFGHGLPVLSAPHFAGGIQRFRNGAGRGGSRASAARTQRARDLPHLS